MKFPPLFSLYFLSWIFIFVLVYIANQVWQIVLVIVPLVLIFIPCLTTLLQKQSLDFVYWKTNSVAYKLIQIRYQIKFLYSPSTMMLLCICIFVISLDGMIKTWKNDKVVFFSLYAYILMNSVLFSCS